MCFRPMRYSQTSAARRQQGGYMLVIMLVIIVTGSLYGLLDRLNANAAETSRTTRTNDALKQAREALLVYAATYKERSKVDGVAVYDNGYLPCPDMNGDDGLGTMIGTEAGSCGNQGTNAVGLLPYRSLGLPELRDGDGNCLWYAVSGTHKSNPKAAVVPGENTVAKYRIVDINGIVLLDNTVIDPGHGAAAIVIAPGIATETQVRNIIADKPCGTDASQATAYLESMDTTFTNGPLKDAAGKDIKNDRLSWVSAKDAFSLIIKRSDYTGIGGGGGSGGGDSEGD